MKPITKVLVSFATLGVTITLGWMAYKKFYKHEPIFESKEKKTARLKAEALAIEEAKKAGQTSSFATDAFPLKKGSKGKNVEALQILLNSLGTYPKIKEDRDFGNETYNAVIAFGTDKYPVKNLDIFKGITAKVEIPKVNLATTYQWSI